MRFLCLHGAGTNAKIFEAQMGAIRHELGREHTFEFVEGTVSLNDNLDIDRLVVSREERFAYYIPNNAESFIKAVSDLTNYLASSGPFDGIVAFSQAASLASAVLLLQEVRDIRVRCAIFFSGRSPFIDAGPLPLSNPLVAASERVISIPTAHIWGANDRIEPGEAAILSEMCDPDKRQIHVHGSGHEVPGPRDKEGLEESANAIRRMLFRL